MVIQDALLAAVQVQALSEAVTVILPVPPEEEYELLVGVREQVHPASWLTVKVLPAMVMVPLRAGPLFSDAEYPTVPLPVPLAPEVMVIQSALFVAVQAQALSEAVTLILPVPPGAV
jgi:hypothetical protein